MKRSILLLAGSALFVTSVFSAVWLGRRPLIRFAACGHPTLLSVLVLGGLEDTWQYSGALRSLSCGDADSLVTLFHAPTTIPNSDARLLCAVLPKCSRENLPTQRALFNEALRSGIDLNSLCESARLLGAVQDVRCAEMLFGLGVKCERDGVSCLPDVHPSAPPGVFEALLRSGASASGYNQFGRTALHQLPPREVAQVLFKYGADPKMKDGMGRTPLDIAYQESNEEAIQYLLESGATAAKFRSPQDAERVRLEEEARGIYLRGTGSGGGCSLGVSSSGAMLSASGNQWATVVGAKLKVSARCPGGGAIHWVLMKNDGNVVVGANNLMAGGQGSFEMDVVEKLGGVPLLFFVSDDFVGNLAKAVESKKARFGGQVTLTAGASPSR